VLPATVTQGLVHLGFALGTADAVDVLSGVMVAAGHRVLEQPTAAASLGAARASSSTPTATGSSSPSERPGDAWSAAAPL
jgi:hypothetical protein